MTSDFTGFPKIARLSRECVITEKIDGTNAQIYIAPVPKPSEHSPDWPSPHQPDRLAYWYGPDASMWGIWAGCRTRWLRPERSKDNHYFAAWVLDNVEELKKLGPGRHFGEWWGQDINRGYGLSERRFSLFNTSRWSQPDLYPQCCYVVPILYQGIFDTVRIDAELAALNQFGSRAAPGFMNPEGIIIYHTAANMMFKKTIKKDEEWKGKK